MTDRLLTTAEAAEMVLSNINTLAYWRHMGTGPRWAKIGKRVVYRESDVRDWVDAQFAAADGGAR